MFEKQAGTLAHRQCLNWTEDVQLCARSCSQLAHNYCTSGGLRMEDVEISLKLAQYFSGKQIFDEYLFYEETFFWNDLFL